MSLAQGIDTFMKGSIAADNLREGQRARTLQEKQIQLKEEEAGYARDAMDMSRAMALAEQLGVSKRGGLELDVPKLTDILKTGRANQKFNPQAEELAALIANTDYTARKNEGFSFGGLSIGPDNTLTLKGSYEGKDGQKYATTGGGPGAEEEVAFAPVGQVANLLSNQYNQMWSKRANAGTYNQITQKQKLAGTFDQTQENRRIVRKAVGDLTEQVDTFLASSDDPAYAAASRKLKNALSQAGSLDDQLEVLRDFGAQLDLPVGQVVTPEVEQAVAEEQANVENQMQPAEESAPVDNSAQIADLERRMANVPKGRGGEKRKKALQSQIDALKGIDTEEPKKVSSGGQMNRERRTTNAPEVDNLVKKAEESVASGGEKIVRATAEELAALKKALEADGVTSFADLNKTNIKNQKAILAVLSSATYVDATQRAVFQKELTNLTETGTLSYDAKSLATAENTARTTRVSEANSLKGLEQLQQEVGEKTAGKVQEAQKNFKDALYGEGQGKDRELTNELQWDQRTVRTKIFGSSGAFSQLFEEYAAADDAVRDGASGVGNITGRKRDRLRRELNSMYSQVVQAMNESGKYEWSWLTRDTAEGVITDDTFQRIRLKADETGFEVIDPASGQPTGDTIPASDISRIMGGRYFEDFKNELKAAKR